MVGRSTIWPGDGLFLTRVVSYENFVTGPGVLGLINQIKDSVHPGSVRLMRMPEVAGGSLPALGYEPPARRPDLQAMHWYCPGLPQPSGGGQGFLLSFVRPEGFLRLRRPPYRRSPEVAEPTDGPRPRLLPAHLRQRKTQRNLAQTRARSNATIASYNQAVVDAVRQVAECGIELEGLGRQLRLQCSELEAHQSALASLQAKHACGLVDRIALAEGRLPVVSQQAKLIQLRQQQVLAEVNLTRALGGGYRADPLSGGNH